MKKAGLILLFTLVTIFSFAQQKTYIGLDFSGSNDLYKITDSGTELTNPPLKNNQFAITVRQDINKYLSIETGLMRKHLVRGLIFTPLVGSGGEWYGGRSNIIPLKLITRINIRKEKIYLVPTIGINYYMCGHQGGSSYGGYQKEEGGDSVHSQFTTTSGLHANYFLLQLGLSSEFLIWKKFIFSIFVNRYIGFERILTTNINYTVNKNPQIYTASEYTKGDFWNLGIGIKYPLQWKIYHDNSKRILQKTD
jgi:hypothetical protein